MWGLIAGIIIADQILKIWVKTHMHMGEDIPLIGDWCLLHFVENEGFAFGMTLGGTVGKVILSLVRMVASAALIWFLIKKIRKGIRMSLLLCVTLITAGAMGNLIDCCFYGLIFNESSYSVAQLFPPEGGYAPFLQFNESSYSVAQLFPPEGGYAPFLQGKVVDMFYFPLFETELPGWLPFWGGDHFEFFSAIFNIADAAITVGTIWLIIDQMFFSPKNTKKEEENASENPEKSEKVVA